ncbi:hypothetical protein ABH926_007324 [Catenulispora sp. GP43]|uniref:CU044_2847 family protein n=1 Tax=Catenulispora sp. GP43 TaxID=3156263 RepID=UPI003517CF0D
MTMDADGVPRRVELPTGELIWVRVQVPEPRSDERGPEGTAPDVGGRRSSRRDSAESGDDGQISKLVGFTETVGGIAHSVRKSLSAVRPDRVEVEFGLEIDGSTGKIISMVATGHAKASIKVKLAWEHQDGLAGGAAGDAEAAEAEAKEAAEGAEAEAEAAEAAEAEAEAAAEAKTETAADPGTGPRQVP